jgi:hypothetical protein
MYMAALVADQDSFSPPRGEQKPRLPDREAFVAGVERATNSYDAQAIPGIFARDAVKVVITGGGRAVNRGVDEIDIAWPRSDAGCEPPCPQASRRRRLSCRRDRQRMARSFPRPGRGIWRRDLAFRSRGPRRPPSAAELCPRSVDAAPLQALRMFLGSPRIALSFRRRRLGRR